MKHYIISLVLVGISLVALPVRANDTINCTATPHCTALGYTQNADSCPDGGIKCPFDETRMFCLRSADLGFRIKNDVKVGDFLYTDGTSSATYTPGKGVVGIVLRPHPGNKRHALVVMLPNQSTNYSYQPYFFLSNLGAVSACSDGFGRGVFGTGKYLAGIGETVEFIGLRSTLNAVINRMGGGDYSFYSYNMGMMTSTPMNSSNNYWGKYNGEIGNGNINDISGFFVCVMYL